MRVFWLILALVVAAAIVVFFQPEPTVRPAALQAASDERTIAAMVNAAVDAAVAAPTPVTPAAPSATEALVRELLTERASEAGSIAATDPPIALETTGESLDLGLGRTIAHATIEPGRIERRADGALIADGRWTIRGAGTDVDPYLLSWDLLTSAMDTFQPRQTLDRIPQRIALLDGTRVRIEGYVAFPLIAKESAELLAMQNQWDGCCIGMPPTAYDAIEVRLAAPVPVGRRHVALFGTLEGIFRVEPYVIDGWLVGLYLLDDATLRLDF